MFLTLPGLLLQLLSLLGNVCHGNMAECIRNNTSCYLFVKNSKPWENASYYCHAVGGHLLRVDSLQEHNFIKGRVAEIHGTGRQYWTDGNDRKDEDTWIWGSCNNRLTVKYWNTGEPNQKTGQEDCLAYDFRENRQGWNDENCNVALSFICEMEIREDAAVTGRGNGAKPSADEKYSPSLIKGTRPSAARNEGSPIHFDATQTIMAITLGIAFLQ